VKFPGDEGDFDGDRDFAVQAVAKGWAALAMEQRAMGECGSKPDGHPNCNHPALQAILLGRTLIGERCHDVSCALDMVEEHFPMIDRERIFMTGNSGGGTTTIYATALDTRIKAAMPSCALCGYFASIGAMQHCPCNYIPGIMKHFDMGDLVALAAPRPYVAVNGVSDASFPVESAKEQVTVGRVVYEALGAGDKLRHVIGDGGHRFYAAPAWPQFDEVTGW
jgi:poly(3-hydroxybutyrate) depolymerase